MADEVRDNPAQSRFELDADKPYGRRLLQAPAGRDHLHAYGSAGGAVPRGVGSRLAKGALEAARERGLKVVAKCPFIGGYIAKHAEFGDPLR